MKKRISQETVMHVAALSRITLTKEEAKRYTKDLSEILDSFKALKSVKAKPTFRPVDVKDVLRSDAIEKSLTNEEALAHTPHKEKGFFKGPRAV